MRRPQRSASKNRVTPRHEPKSWAAPLAAGLIVLATVAAFSNSFAGPLILDDRPAILENPTIRQLWPLATPLSPPAHGETVTGRPVLNYSLAVNYAISRLDVWSYHATNLAIHIAGALLLFGLLRRTFLLPAMRDRWGAAATPAALIAALFWALHPLQTESVTYIVQRAESLVGLFYLLTLYALVRSATAARPLAWYVLAVAACLLGMGTKEVMVSAPLIAILYDRTFLTTSFRESLRRRWGLYLALATTWWPLAWLVLDAGGRGATAGFRQGVDCWPYLCTQFGAIIHYLRLSVWPYPLVLDYGTDLARTAAEIVRYAIMVALLGLATLTALWRWPKIGFLGACFFALLAPTSSVVPVVTQTMAEHRMYLPLAAVVVAIVAAAHIGFEQSLRPRWLSQRTSYLLFGCLAAAIAATLGVLTFQRNADYRTECSIWQDTADKTPANARAQSNLGLVLATSGDLDNAIARFRRAVDIKPDYPEAHYNLGNALTAQGSLDDAIPHYQIALRLRPQYGKAHHGLASALVTRHRLDEAIAHYWTAVELQPQCAEALNDLAWLLATCPKRSQRDGPKAIELARQSDRLTRGTQPETLDTLAAAYAEVGRFPEAVATARRAMELATQQDKQPLVSAIQSRIALYQNAKPFHQTTEHGPIDKRQRTAKHSVIEQHVRPGPDGAAERQ